MKTDKKFLYETTLEYLEAITSNDVSRLPLAAECRMTVNGKNTSPGNSPVWGSPRRIPYRQSFVDPVTGSSVFFGIITNTTTTHAGFGEKWWLYTVRLKTESGLITEIEEIINDNTFAHYERKPWEMTPNQAFSHILPEDERLDRESLITVVESYWNAVERSVDGFSVPFHPDAVRYECGTITTDAKNFPNSARGDFIKAENAGWRWRVLNRRYPVIDTDRGVVVSYGELSMTDSTNPDFLPCIVTEVFKIESGLIKELNAFFYAGESVSNW